MNYKTGYFAVPGTMALGKVHIVFDGKPICNCFVNKEAEFQFCAMRVVWEYISCYNCRKIYKSHIEKQAKLEVAKLQKRWDEYVADPY